MKIDHIKLKEKIFDIKNLLKIKINFLNSNYL